MKITVLGAGMVGSAIARDLAHDSDFEVTVVDASDAALTKLESAGSIARIKADLLEDGKIGPLVVDSGLVISAVPGFMGFETLRRVIEAGKDIVDISFFAEDPFDLDELAKSKGVTAVVDCGVAPGLCNIMAGYTCDQLDHTDKYVCYVGGLPQVRQWPFEYKAVFSPRDVLEEYIRPARFVEYGKEVVRPALTDLELIDFPEVGTLEAFNTDGLRTLRNTMDIAFMREKTMRYPGHAELMRIFRDSGFFGTEPIEVGGQQVKPLSLTSKLLFDQWRLAEGEADFTVMQVIIHGHRNQERVCYTGHLLDRYDEETQTTSMARTTGYTCSIVARQVIKGMIQQKGICPPEYIGRAAGCYDDLKTEYKKRKIHLWEKMSKEGEECAH